MAKSKFYGVKVGKIPGVYTTWEECKKQVDGYPGALYKSFPAKDEASDYVSGNSPDTNAAGPDNSLAAGYHIYVDGSYLDKRYSWAFVVYDGPQVIYENCGVGEDAEAAIIRNVAGELEATVKAIQWADAQGLHPIVIHHDYIGISEWAVGKWKTNNKFTEAYARFVRPYLNWVRFHKVAGHSGVAGNELADKLAGKALGRQ
jgi:ribonuclease HI